MNILRVIQWMSAVAVTAATAFICKLTYGYWLHKAETEAANSKVFRMDCTGRTFPDCDFTEVPVRVHTFTEVILPTLLCMVPVVAVAVFCLVAIFVPQALSADQACSDE
jgi:hypothetical protein